jgi:hypothetical protein
MPCDSEIEENPFFLLNIALTVALSSGFFYPFGNFYSQGQHLNDINFLMVFILIDNYY